MTIQVVLGALGALLLLTAVLGGGFELRELKIPQVGVLARSAAGILGALFLLFAIGLSQLDSSGAVAATPTPKPVRLALTDELGDGQISESVSVIFDGRKVGDLKVDADYPTAEIDVTLPAAGRYDYTLASDSDEFASDGSEIEVSGSGAGTISVADGDTLDVQMADNGQARDITLVHE
jgi:hypothetical protein